MTSDLNIYRTAKLLVDQHGEDAPINAAMRTHELLAAGDRDGQMTWILNVPAIRRRRCP
jgi:hypothetical protein